MFLWQQDKGLFWETARQTVVYFFFCSVVDAPVTPRMVVNSSADAVKTLNPFSLRGDTVHVGPPSLAARAIFAIGINEAKFATRTAAVGFYCPLF